MERLPDASVINAYTGLIIGRLCHSPPELTIHSHGKYSHCGLIEQKFKNLKGKKIKKFRSMGQGEIKLKWNKISLVEEAEVYIL